MVASRQNYLTIMTVIADQLEAGISPQRLLGIDVPRLAASAAFFERVAQDDAGLSLEVARTLFFFLSVYSGSGSRQALSNQ